MPRKLTTEDLESWLDLAAMLGVLLGYVVYRVVFFVLCSLFLWLGSHDGDKHSQNKR